MLIVVVVLVTLMTMTFRLSSLGGDSWRHNKTVARLQRLENCLSGYYAAFGTYPPVALHGSRNPWLVVSSHGIQNDEGTENMDIFGWDPAQFRSGSRPEAESRAWDQVEAACRAQPVDCCFPFPERYSDYVEAKSEQLKEYVNTEKVSERMKQVFSAGFDDGVSKNLGRFSQYQDKSEWKDLQLFKFGLMSYLLPRYLVMMNSNESIYEDYDQWIGNNPLPSNALTGLSFNSWREVCRKAKSDNKSDLAAVANIPSQAVCARWMANLEGSVNTAHGSLSVFGVSVAASGENSFNPHSLHVYSPGGFDNDSTANQYILDSCTVWDGWDNDFFYYSPAPYQTYILWSAGKNGRTFPPWIVREGLNSTANACIGAWTEDDIVGMSH
jgi:hypothetical protein